MGHLANWIEIGAEINNLVYDFFENVFEDPSQLGFLFGFGLELLGVILTSFRFGRLGFLLTV